MTEYITKEQVIDWFRPYGHLDKPIPFETLVSDLRGMKSADVEPVQEWISVTERLPDWRDGKVLVFTKYGFSICERTVNNRWRGQHANWITHWAYLPQPPKGE